MSNDLFWQVMLLIPWVCLWVGFIPYAANAAKKDKP